MEPEPEPQAELEQLLDFLSSADPQVVEQALAAVVAYSGSEDGIALLRESPEDGPTAAALALLRLATRSVNSAARRTQASVGLVNLSADGIIARGLVAHGAAGSALALAAAVGGSGGGEGGCPEHDSQQRLLQVCCNLTRSTDAVQALLVFAEGVEQGKAEASAGKSVQEEGGLEEVLTSGAQANVVEEEEEEEEAPCSAAMSLLLSVTTQLLGTAEGTGHGGGHCQSQPALGALLRLLTNITADPGAGQTFVMQSLLPKLLDGDRHLCRCSEEDVRAGLYAALRNLVYFKGPTTKDAEMEARHRELLVQHDLLPVLLTPLLAPGNLDLGEGAPPRLSPPCYLAPGGSGNNATTQSLSPRRPIAMNCIWQLMCAGPAWMSGPPINVRVECLLQRRCRYCILRSLR
eukprot:COSAG01_NODE_6716_length_3531_cov_3.330711_1_plen_405_part_00